ncbi:MAG: hypothetical protein HOF11_13830 [Rhodospirillaceae bacterium]|jgi:cytochrome c-type protein NapC|nr:hypothetical protein [Rhodospirillaceae bacterium]
MNWLSRLRRGLLGLFKRRPIVSAAALFLGGIVFWGGFNWSMEVSNTESFCISCHVMREYVYQEYKTTIHYRNRTGVRASCPDCHVPREWLHKMVRKLQATNELYHWAMGSIYTPTKFAAKRMELAEQVWDSMAATDSRECRNCHDVEFMKPGQQSTTVGKLHELTKEWEMTCIDCHKGIAHTLPKGFNQEAVLDEMHDRMETEKMDCRECHQGMAGTRKGDGWD